MTLPALLEQAARLMPERVQNVPFPWFDYTYPHSWQVHLRGEWEAIWLDGAEDEWMPTWAQDVEYACREEIESRGWEWGIEGKAGQSVAHVWRSGLTPDNCHVTPAPTPAEALLTALVAAVEGERGARMDTGAWNEDYEGDGDEPSE